ncbi:zinc finger protein CONSTANS-LIKE 16-like [Gastrolobium bilobum]|uniref:zinc finger protein CONSTANS-LIKE 16-like n=1 Tax=Gastrolobium bilobum TaxID=150636 RepID=UPI002AB21AEE|nr:zinc finger protein CONSTANS-LIKE 16-like [Gastrolobium bilobum]
MTPANTNEANAVGGKTARACDSCITKRARWYCAADDAFLCQACDSSVHSANSLARRHERVRLNTASYKSTSAASDELNNCAPSWHHGFTKKARTPRHGKHSATRQTPKSWSNEPARNNPFHLVPEVGLDEVNSHEENEEQLLYRVPIFDPFVVELCSTPSSVTSAEGAIAVAAAPPPEVENMVTEGSESKVPLAYNNHSLEGFLPSDIELAEFAADVESLLGKGLENECIGMEELGLVDTKKEEWWDCSAVGSGKVKVEEEESAAKLEADEQMEMGRGSFELSFDYDSHETCEEVKEKVDSDMGNGGEHKERKRKISLQLDYEAVIIAWASQKSPWTTGDKPNLDPDECWPDCMGTCGTELHHPYGELGRFGCHPIMTDGGREARVSRYREKRRTRLFSKKIRYEVRKLNAEKRPRMKGRFVKRASFAAPTFPLQNK